MSRNGSSSPALQHHLSGEQSENGEGAQINYPDKDIRCPGYPNQRIERIPDELYRPPDSQSCASTV